MNHHDLLAQIGPLIENRQLTSLTLSKPHKTQKELRRVKIAPLALKAGYHIQFSLDDGTHEQHENLVPAEAVMRLEQLLGMFQQLDGRFTGKHFQAILATNGDVHLTAQQEPAPGATPRSPQATLAHNRTKNHILAEGEVVDFLVELGIMSPDGAVFKTRYDKFRQINRFVEFVDNLVGKLDTGRTVRIIDFACGKAYLTFALYHYLVRIKGFSVELLGLDLKQEVIEKCSQLARKLNMQGLEFKTGDIADYRDNGDLDMVVSLHACDTATDLALAFAIQHHTRVILCAPCCQHELFGQLKAPILKALTQHGLLKERFAALATDALRCQLLEIEGYQVDMVEFVDPEHTPKNLLIRAWHGGKSPSAARRSEYESFRDLLSATPYLEGLLAHE